MSDFLFSTRPGEQARLGAALRAALPGSGAFREMGGSWGSLAIALEHHDPPRVHEDDTRVVVLAGFPLLVRNGTRQRIDGAADMAALGDALAQEGAGVRDLLDGPFALLVVERTGRAVVVTDRMSFVPAYGAHVDGASLAGTHPDAVAHAAGVEGDVDPVSLADFLANENIAHPHTIYRGVHVLEPATVTTIATGGAAHAYWAPDERQDFPDRRSAALTLRDALVDEVRTMLDGVDGAGILFSAGEDARAVLGAVPEPSSMLAVTFAERANREVRLARRAAHAYGAHFRHGVRAPDHYVRNLELLSRLAGSQHRFIDVHAYGLHAALGLDEMRVVLGGFSADTLLKGEYAERTPHRPRALAGLRADLLAQVAARRGAHLERVRALRPRSAQEWAAMWPAQVRKATGNIQGNRRLMRIYEPYMSNRIVDIAAGVPQEWKRDRALFHEAVRPLLRAAWHVPHVRSRYPWFGPRANLLLGAALNVSRGVNDRLRGLRDRQGGWTDPADMLRTSAMDELTRRLPLVPPLTGVFDDARAADSLVRSWPPRAQLLIRQLASILSA